MSWFSGFAGGMLAGLVVMHWKRLPKIAVLATATPALAIGHAIGRIGCFLVGDDYGRPSNLPWAVAFPEGLPPSSVPVHPTQLYEAAALVALAWLLFRWRKQARPDAFVLGAYLGLAGTIRFLIEFLRVNVRVLAGLSVAHLASLMAIGVGVGFLFRVKRPASTGIGAAWSESLCVQLRQQWSWLSYADGGGPAHVFAGGHALVDHSIASDSDASLLWVSHGIHSHSSSIFGWTRQMRFVNA